MLTPYMLRDLTNETLITQATCALQNIDFHTSIIADEAAGKAPEFSEPARAITTNRQNLEVILETLKTRLQ